MAIQVNGTTVIDNSRALTNISSVDSATVTALGNAGVGGGASSLITGETSIGSYASTKSFTLGGNYDVHILQINGLQVNSDSGGCQILWRLKDSSNNPITASYNYVGGSNGSNRAAGYMEINNSQFYGANYASGNWPGFFSMIMRIHNARSSSIPTYIEGFTVYMVNQDGAIYSLAVSDFQYHFKDNSVHNAVYGYNHFTADIGNGTYKMWGVDL